VREARAEFLGEKGDLHRGNRVGRPDQPNQHSRKGKAQASIRRISLSP
jgi:hypothetical protein